MGAGEAAARGAGPEGAPGADAPQRPDGDRSPVARPALGDVHDEGPDLTPLRVLVVARDQVLADEIVPIVGVDGIDVQISVLADEQATLDHLEEVDPELIVADSGPPHFPGRGLPAALDERGLEVPVILVSDAPSDDEVAASIRRGVLGHMERARLSRIAAAAVGALRRRELRRVAAQAVAALERSEKRFRSLVQNGSHVIATVDPAGTLTYISPSIERVTGFPPEHYVGTDIDEHVHPDDGSRAGFERSLAVPGSIITDQKRVRCRAGGYAWVECTRTNLLHAPEVEAVIYNFYDITEQRSVLAALRESEQRHRLQARLLEGVGEAAFAVDGEGRIIYWNSAAEKMLGWSYAEAIGQRVVDLAPPSHRELAASIIDGAPAAVWTGELVLGRRDGTDFPALMTTSPVLDEEGASLATMFVLVDLTGVHAANAALEARARQQAAVAELGSAALADRDVEHFMGTLLDRLNQELATDRAALFELDVQRSELVLVEARGVPGGFAATMRVPVAPDRMMGRVLDQREPIAVTDLAAPDAIDAAPQILELGVRSGVAVLVGSEERPYGVLAVGSTEVREHEQQEVDFVAGAANVLGVAIERHRAEAELARLAHRDSLTGLANRAAFDEHLEALLAGDGREVALLLLDLDGMKLINDVLGHSAGDAVLRSAAARITGLVDDDALVARIDSDSLAVVVDVGSDDGAADLARALAGALAEAHTFEGLTIFADATIGVADVRGVEADQATPGGRRRSLERHADLALQRARRLGRGRVEVFDGALRDDAAARLEIANALRDAATRGELFLRYQPEVPLGGAGPLVAEVLLRWEHPELGLVPPDRFVPIAEESGSMPDIGAWVLRAACRQLRAWRDGGVACPDALSVNLSPRQLIHPGLVATVAEVLDEEGIDPGSLTFEITETAVMADPEAALARVTELRTLGVQVAIDDFGTGYSSLALLQQFPVTALKVDRSFVAGLGQRTSDESIVAAVLGLARALGLVSIAEGVETRAQLDVLLELGCDFGQGYLWSKPLSPGDLADWCARPVDAADGPSP